MLAVANMMLANASPEVCISHGEEKIIFSISLFGRKNFQEEVDVFQYINQYWASLPLPTQDKIFGIYKECQFIMDNIHHKSEQTEALTVKVTELVGMHQIDDIKSWLAFKSNVIIPDSINTEYQHSIDNNTSREKTYIKSDYVELIAMSLVLRCMVPIWGEHISSTRKDTGTLFKEFYSFQLLSRSYLMTSAPMEKLKVYISNIASKDKHTADNTLKGISSEDFGFWLLSLVCVRRVCIGDIRGFDPKANMITFVHKYVIQKVQSTDNNFENATKEKRFDDKTPDVENKISTLERYKIKTNIAPGEIVELEFSMKDIYEVVNKLTCKVTPSDLDRAIQTSSGLLNERILDPQMMLLRWVFKPVISARGLMYLPKPMIVTALAALETVLWARGHHYLAILASSHAIISDKEMLISPVDSKMRVPKELSEKLDVLYPFTKVSGDKKDKSTPKTVNLAAKSIDNLTNNLMMFSWRSTADDAKLIQVFGSNSRRLPIKPDIKTDLTKLVIELGERSWI